MGYKVEYQGETPEERLRCSLKLQILMAVLACFALSIVIAVPSQKASHIVLDHYYSQEAELRHLTEIAETFGAHVSEKKLSAGDTKAIDEWGAKNDTAIVLPDGANERESFKNGADAKARWRQAGVTLRLHRRGSRGPLRGLRRRGRLQDADGLPGPVISRFSVYRS